MSTLFKSDVRNTPLSARLELDLRDGNSRESHEKRHDRSAFERSTPCTIIGAGVALLLAKRSGKETREWLAVKTRDAKGRLQDAVERTKAAVRHEAQVIASSLESPKH